MIVLVSLLAYSLLGLAISIVTAILWRTRAIAPANLPPVARARRLLQLRLLPSVAAAAITLFVITPAFAIFEPSGGGEEVGPILKIVSVVALILIGASLAGAARSLWLTTRLERQWLRSSVPIAASRAAGLRAFAIQSPSPMVALVGVFEPKLIAARTVVDACTPEEIACIVAHERGHFDARDNLKRWIMASLPDVLRWTPIHNEIVEAWHHAAEDAADDAATGGHAVARGARGAAAEDRQACSVAGLERRRRESVRRIPRTRTPRAPAAAARDRAARAARDPADHGGRSIGDRDGVGDVLTLHARDDLPCDGRPRRVRPLDRVAPPVTYDGW